MSCTVHIRTSGVDRGVDHERRSVQKSVGPGFFEDIASVIDQNQIGGLDQREVEALIKIL